MKNYLFLLLPVLPAIVSGKDSVLNNQHLLFTENKGQVTDQHNNQRQDIDVVLKSAGMNMFAGSGALHYQHYRVLNTDGNKIATYRMDVELVGADKNVLPQLLEKQAYSEWYYTQQFEEQGAGVYSYSKVLYANIYPGIDWLLYIKDNKLEQDFIVHEGADPKQIKIRYSGATELLVNKDGSLKASTPMGTITEAAPHCFTATGSVQGSYQLEGNILSFNTGSYNGTLIIDPTVVWGTYYYGTSPEATLATVKCHTPAVIYAAGDANTGCNGIATVGAYQDTINGNFDGIIVKFDSAGNRLWATYYGGDSTDAVLDLETDIAGNLYVCGSTRSPGTFATMGSYQQTVNGVEDGFISKFTSGGQRVWGTYYGGDSLDNLRDISVHQSTVYIGGVTHSINDIASLNGFQTVYGGGLSDNMLLKFDSSGQRQWATYYGGGFEEHTFAYISSDNDGNVYMTGRTFSADNISSPGSYQDTWQGVYSDAYLVKFNAAGQRLWATYYGGQGSESVGGIAVDQAGAVYVAGSTTSIGDISTAGSLQEMIVGTGDLFIVKFNPSGQRVWGTYYGGNGLAYYYSQRGAALASDVWDNIYLIGVVDGTGLPTTTSNAMQTTYGGGARECFVTKLDSAGTLQWASYYGGSGDDFSVSLSPDNIGNVYLSGSSSSNNGISTASSFIDSNITGLQAGFLVKIHDTTYTNSIVRNSSKNSISIYPNPTTGIINIRSHAAGICHVYSIEGKLLLSKSIVKGRTFFNIPEALSPGIYFIKCKLSTGEQVTERLVYR